VFILDRMLVGGIQFVLRRLVDAAQSEHDDVPAIKEELLLAQVRLETGDISPEQFAEIEASLFERLRSARGGSSEPIDSAAIGRGSMEVTGIEVSSALDGEVAPAVEVESAVEVEPAPAKKKKKRRRR
jgi:hypothetical protein